jgi:hypothetical protein
MNGKTALDHPATRPVCCVIEGYTEGDQRAHARAQLKEIKPSVFILIPIYLREISGPDVRWCSPEPGGAIETSSPITNFDEATTVFTWWATKTFALNRKL